MTKNIWILFCFLIFDFHFSVAQDLDLELTSIFKNELFLNSSYSYHLIDVETEKVLSSKNADLNLVPASTLKLLTLFTGIVELGEGYKFTTKVGYEGVIMPDGTLEGNLIVIGGGDPSLGSNRFTTNSFSTTQIVSSIKNAVVDADINCIDGHILVYNNFSSDPPVHPTWQWDDISNYYASGPWELNIRDNSFNIYFEGNRKYGEPSLILNHEPAIFGLNLESQVTTEKENSGDNAYVYGGPYDYKKIIRGTIPAGREPFRIKGAIPNPPEFFANEIRLFLEESGIQSHGIHSVQEVYPNPSDFIYLTTFESPPLSDLARHASFESDNLFCESIFKQLSHSGESLGSYQASSIFVENFIKDMELDYKSIKIVDGSGLSFRNRLNSKLLTEFLFEVNNKIGLKKLKSFIPKCGEEGTVKSLRSLSDVNIWAKSGSMGGVMGYAGIVNSREGNHILFCVLVNGYNAKNKDVREYLISFMNSIYLLG